MFHVFPSVTRRSPNPARRPVSWDGQGVDSRSVSIHVRAIQPDELPGWVDVTYVAFHNNRPTDVTAAYHRERLDGDTARCLAAVDGQRLVGTYESFATDLTLPGAACVPANAVTAVSVLPTHHRRGALTSMLTQDMLAAKERGEAVSVLIAAEYPIYGRFGFGPATSHAAYRLATTHAHFTRAAPGNVDLVAPESLRAIAPNLFEQVRRDTRASNPARPFLLGYPPRPETLAVARRRLQPAHGAVHESQRRA